jgi:hypothetical protein
MTEQRGRLSASRARHGLAAVAAVAVLAAGPAGLGTTDAAAAVRPATTGWGTAEELPGLAALDQTDAAVQHALSCPASGDCSIGADYNDATGYQQVIVDTETGGTWGTAEAVPGLATLNHRNAGIFSLSCGSAGNCSAAGYYTDSLDHEQSYLVREKAGTWQPAKEVSGTAALNAGGNSEFYDVSCVSGAACSGGGYYTDASGDQQGYVASETNGAWGSAKKVPGLTALNTGGSAQVQYVSCASAGNCAAGGTYYAGSAVSEPFAVTQSGGTWGKAEEIPGIGALNYGQAGLNGLSCGSAGNCTAVGSYQDSAGNIQAWLATEVNGTWGNAEEVPGTAALDSDGFAVTDAVSCASAGNCSAGGWYTATHIAAFVVTETDGVWGNAKAVPGLAAIDTSNYSQLWTISCGSAGNCSAGGFYWNDSEGGQEAFVVTQTKGTWGKAKEVPGTEALNVNGGGVTGDVSCSSAAHCAAAGQYGDSSADIQVFVDNQT